MLRDRGLIHRLQLLPPLADLVRTPAADVKVYVPQRSPACALPERGAAVMLYPVAVALAIVTE